MAEIVVFSDEPVVEEGLRQILESTGDFSRVHTFHTHEQALQAAEQIHPQVILYSFAVHGGLGVICAIRRIAPNSALVLLAREFPPSLAHQAMEMGVRGIISTTATPEMMHECLRLAAVGENWVQGSLAAELLNMNRVALSPRQSDVLDLLVRGFKNKEIAGELGLSVGTVKAYMTALFEKVGAKDRFELALFGLKNLRHMREESQEIMAEPHLHSLAKEPRRRAERQLR